MTNRRQKFLLSSLAEDLDSAIEQIDSISVHSLENFSQLRNVRAASMQREGARLAELYPANHLRRRTATERSDNDVKWATEAGMVANRMSHLIPKLTDSKWAMYGIIRSDSGTNAANYRISVAHKSGRDSDVVADAYTDESGAYTLSLDVPAADEREASASLRIQIHDDKKRLVMTEEDAVIVGRGRVEFREFLLPATKIRRKASTKKPSKKKKR